MSNSNLPFQKEYEREGWSVKLNSESNKQEVTAYGYTFPLTPPHLIHLKLYRDATNPDNRYFHMKAAHDYIWPVEIETWNDWEERRFKCHCAGYKFISQAGGASTGKSRTEAKIDLLYYLADPKRRAVVVASTTLQDLKGRIWGYILDFIREAVVPLPINYTSSPTPVITYKSTFSKETRKRDKNKDIKDEQHGMFAVAAKRGDDSTTISGWIGKHPKNGLKVSLDEGTDMPAALLKSVDNLDTAQGGFQLTIIGNSCSRHDLHGILSTPKGGWNSIDPLKDNQWQTTQKEGICQFFSCYESPAILDPDPVKRERLGRFFITAEKLKEKEVNPGKTSDAFYRFVLGFWRSASTDSVVIPIQFVEQYKINQEVQWSGLYPLKVVAGLDLAFSTGGDQCILRLAYMGVDIDGKVVLDFKKERLLFPIQIVAMKNRPAELQICDQVKDILKEHHCSIQDLAYDATGQGRAWGSLFAKEANSVFFPHKIYTIRQGEKAVNSVDVVIRQNYDLWHTVREYVQEGQIRGVDNTSLVQLTNRLVFRNEKTGKMNLEGKKEFKSRMGGVSPAFGRSPDEADALTLAVQAALLSNNFTLGETRVLGIPTGGDRHSQFRQMQAMQQVHDDIKEAPAFTLRSGFSVSTLKTLKSGGF